MSWIFRASVADRRTGGRTGGRMGGRTDQRTDRIGQTGGRMGEFYLAAWTRVGGGGPGGVPSPDEMGIRKSRLPTVQLGVTSVRDLSQRQLNACSFDLSRCLSRPMGHLNDLDGAGSNVAPVISRNM